MHAGAAFLDYDNDSRLDVYLVQGGPLPLELGAEAQGGEAARGGEAVGNRLYHNLGDQGFEDVTDAAGVGDLGYGAGVAVADYNRDGWVDLYVTNLGPNRLYRNNGANGSADFTDSVGFTEVAHLAGVDHPGYSTSAAFFDYDGDGDLDLWVCNYVEWSVDREKPCLGANGLAGYCSPLEYAASPDTLYRNDGVDAEGRVTFTDVSEAAGILEHPATGLGVVTADFNGDGLPDVYVANDQMPNHLWINQGNGAFANEALLRGSALNEFGEPEAGMGIAIGDVDHDGDWDLFIVHLSGETNTFYRNEGDYFRDVTDELRLGAVSRPYTGFGTALFDYDNDGTLDLFIANGKVNRGETLALDFREPNQLLHGMDDGSYEDVSDSGGALDLREVSRAAVLGDYDNDGDIDILIANNGGPVRLLRNEASGDRHWLEIALNGAPRHDRDALGARVIVETEGRKLQAQVRPAYGYCSSSDPRLHFGLDRSRVVERLTVIWPDGQVQELENIAADQILSLTAPSDHEVNDAD